MNVPDSLKRLAIKLFLGYMKTY